MNSYLIHHGGCLNGTAIIPGDKSISHRAILLASIAEGTTTLTGFLRAADTLATLEACRQMGVPITLLDNDTVVIEGVGLHGLQAPTHVLNLGNSGTGFRLLTGLLAGQIFDSTLTGDSSLQRRPMERIFAPLRQMGAKIDGRQFPVHIHGQHLKGILYTLPIPSAQIKSALMLAGLYATGETKIAESVLTRDHTERLLTMFGSVPKGIKLSIPADISSAAFFIVGASIAPGSDIYLESIGVNPTRLGVVHILREMGADITFENSRMLGAEPVADIRVQYAPLKGIDIAADYVASAIDEFPILFVAAACAQGVTRLSGAGELRLKESDRIHVMARGLERLGVRVAVLPDGLIIEGGYIQGGEVESDGDHRVVMAFAIAALAARQPVLIQNCANVGTSFPGFVTVAQQLGLAIKENFR